jgi:hypothetical protein
MLVIETWLKLQKFKSTDSGLDLDPFYCPTYNFPTYNEVKIINLPVLIINCIVTQSHRA